MSDDELIKLIAEIWISNGGDSDGFCFCFNKILVSIRDAERIGISK